MLCNINLNDEDFISLMELYELSFDIKCDLNIIRENYNKLLSSNNVYQLVLKDNNRIFGYLKCDIIYTPFGDGKPYMYLSEFCIHKEYRKKGYGKLLLTNASDIAKENNCSYIFLNSSHDKIDAHKIYEKCGYHKRNSDIFKINI